MNSALLTLQATFEEQLKLYGYIIVSTTALNEPDLNFAADFDALLTNYLLLNPPPLTVTTTTIPAPIDNTLTITGTANFLNQENIFVTLSFTVNENNIINLLLSTDLATDWSFTDNFPSLMGYPVNILQFSAASYLFTTQLIENYAWQSNSLSLQKGLSFASYLILTEPFQTINYFLEPDFSVGLTLFFAGFIDPTAMQDPEILYPDINLLGTLPGAVEIPYFETKNPCISFIVSQETDPDDPTLPSFEAWLYFLVDLKIGETDNTDWFGFRATLSENSRNYTFALVPAVSKAITVTSVTNLINSDFTAAIPSTLEDLFDNFGLRGFTTVFYLDANNIPVINSLDITVGATAPWEIGGLTIEDISLRYNLIDPFNAPYTTSMAFFNAQFQFYADTPKEDPLFPGYFAIEILEEGSDQLNVTAAYSGDTDLKKLITTLSGGLAVPDELSDMSFSDFGVSFLSQGSTNSYSFYASATVEFPLQLLGADNISSDFQVNVNWEAQNSESYEQQLQKSSATYTLNGGLTLGNSYFTAELNWSDSAQILNADWQALNEDYLGINDLVTALGFEPFAIPDKLDLNLKEAHFSYDFLNSIMLLEAQSATYGSVLLMSQKISGKYEYIVIYQLSNPENTSSDSEPNTIKITSIPLFGDLPEGQQIILKTLQINCASGVIDSVQMKQWQILLDAADLQVDFDLPPSVDYPGASITATVILGTLPCDLFLALSTAEPAQSVNQQLMLSDTENTPPMNALTVWIKAQNSLGPIYLNRIGFAYQNEKFYILLDAALELTSLRLEAMSLGLGVALTDLTALDFTISGLGIDFQQAPTQISGGLLRTSPTAWDFEGEAILTLGTLKVLGLGAYSTLDNGEASLFVFALLNQMLGGTPYFYVTGLSAGFGYNRALRIPVQSEVQDFPLVAGLSDPNGAFGTANPTPDQVLASLGDWTPPQQGQYWFALGVQGTTFEVINTNALFVVEFGKQTIISIIGASTLKQPQKGTPFTYAVLDIVASFLPDEGEVTIAAQLAPGAYILTKDARLKGGFAFYSWFGSNPHAGEFVFTIGGYGNNFTPPDYYPKVAPVEIDWKVADGIIFTGSAYFAILPAMMLAGTDLELSYHIGALKAWLKAKTDIELYWKPFYFVADVSVSVGVSLRLKLLFVTTTISAEVGSDLHLWGPAMGGKVYVDWCILAFTIGFGASKKSPSSSIDWDEFAALLPSKTMTATPDDPEQVFVYIDVNEGLISQVTLDEDPHWLVRAEQLQFTASCALPATKITVNSNEPLEGPAVGMCRLEGGITSDEYHCEQTITISSGSTLIDLSAWNIVKVEKSLPRAMWNETGSPPKLDKTTHNCEQSLIATVGVQINPLPSTPANGTPAMIIAEVFKFKVINETDENALSLNPQTSEQSINSTEANNSFAIIAEINSSDVTTARTTVYDNLVKLGFNDLANKSLAAMANDPGAAFVDEPRLGTTL